MRKALFGLFFCLIILLAIGLLGISLAGCGSNAMVVSNPEPSAGRAPVSLTIGDDPPAGVAIIRFQVQIASATLQPTNTADPAVSLLLSPMNVELLHLQTETAPLGNINVPAGSYTSLTASFANPQMTIFNNTNQTLTLGAQTCLAGQFCIFNPPLNQMSATVAAPTAPFPLTLSANSPVGFEMHFDVNASVQGNLTVSPTITVKQVIPPTATSPISQFHIVGRITSVSSPDFTIQAGFGGLSASIVTNSSTSYSFPTCGADNFSCLVDGQVVDVGVNLIPGGTFTATSVRLLEQPNLPSLQGVVVSVNTAANSFNMILMDLQESFTSVVPGLLITVQTNSSTTFSVDSDGVTIPANLSFANFAGIVAGQTVEIHPMATPVVTPGPTALPLITVSTDSVTLEPTQIAGVVGTVNASGVPPSFTLLQLSPVLTHSSISLIDVDVVAGTVFVDVTGLGNVNPGDRVFVGGLLFSTTGAPTLVAERVRDN
jgi:Domain of unknown function (DUF5666)